jgi:alpha 1,3-glucosidase
MNAAETWIDIKTHSTPEASFVSEAGALDVFILYGRNPKEILTSLSQVTGFAPLPPAYSLGFHFSKYENISAKSMMERDNMFEAYGFPVDVHWMDFPYTETKAHYFVFNPD